MMLLPVSLNIVLGFLKVAIVLKEKNTKHEWDDPTKSPFRKKVAIAPKPGGVKRVIIIGIVENVPETYNNVLAILDVLKIKHDQINTTFSSDLKLLNILIG